MGYHLFKDNIPSSFLADNCMNKVQNPFTFFAQWFIHIPTDDKNRSNRQENSNDSKKRDNPKKKNYWVSGYCITVCDDDHDVNILQ